MQHLPHRSDAQRLKIRPNRGQRRNHVVHRRHVIEPDQTDVTWNANTVLIQGTRDAHRLIVVRRDHDRRQLAALIADGIENMVHPGVRLGRLPGLATHRDGTDGAGAGQFHPGIQSRHRTAPSQRTGEVQRPLVTVFGQHAHHIAHRTPLVDTDDRHAVALARVNQAQPFAHAEFAVRGGDHHARLRQLRVAGRFEHDIGGREHDERVDVLLVERAAQILELRPRAQRLMHHHHRHEQAVLARHHLDRGNRRNRAVELHAACDQADRAGTVRCERSRRVAGTIIERLDGILHFGAGGVGDIGRIVDDPGHRLMTDSGELRDFEHGWAFPPASLGRHAVKPPAA